MPVAQEGYVAADLEHPGCLRITFGKLALHIVVDEHRSQVYEVVGWQRHIQIRQLPPSPTARRIVMFVIDIRCLLLVKLLTLSHRDTPALLSGDPSSASWPALPACRDDCSGLSASALPCRALSSPS